MAAGVASVASHGGGAAPLRAFWRGRCEQPIVDVDGSEVFVTLPEQEEEEGAADGGGRGK
jgi:hypothetical protein